jgi:predicted extracellular nuclease
MLVLSALLLGSIGLAHGQVVISQVYGGGGNSGATWKNDFVELFNPGSAAVNVTGWSVQYASATGSSWQVTALSGSIQPGGYFLVQEAAGTGGTAPLPTPDAIGNIAMAAGAGKVALVSNATALTGTCPTGAVDFIGYGATANCFEGAFAPTLTNTTAALRAGGGCTDTNNNSTDFASGAPNPRNSASPANPCSGALTITNSPTLPNATVAQLYGVTFAASGGSGSGYSFLLKAGTLPPGLSLVGAALSGTPTTTAGSPFQFTIQVSDNAAGTASKDFQLTVNPAAVCIPSAVISQIQGSGNTSPLAGTVVTTSGIVTGRKSNGFFFQMPPPGDNNPNTSDGLFVFTSSTPPVAAVPGNSVCVTGTVQEFSPSSDPNSPSQTEISGPTNIFSTSTGNPLPPPVLLGTEDLSPSAPLLQLEKYEGMRVQVSTLTVTAPTRGSINEAAATATSNGIFYGVLPGTPRPFREPGIQLPDPLPAGSPCCVPRWDANPEVLSVSTMGQTGGAALDVTSGQTVANIVGPLEYSGRAFTVDTDPANPPVVSGTPATSIPLPDPSSAELTIASMNMQRFYDTVNDPSTSDVALTPQAFQNRVTKASLGIRTVMKMPDIIGVEEMENLETLQTVAAQVNADALAAGQAPPNYQAYLFAGKDIGGINVGFLVKTPKVNVIDVTQLGATATYIDPVNGQPAPLNDRPPVVLRATATRTGSDQSLPFTVIVNHLRSLSSIDDPVDGPRVRAKREAQAEFLANYIQSLQAANPGESIVSIGDYNAYQFSDGYADIMGAIKGTPAPADQVVLASPSLVSPSLTDLVDTAPAEERYSYSFNGSAQELDHILVNTNMLQRLSRYAVARNGADFPEVYRNDPNRPERLSDHDWPAAYFTMPLNHTPVVSPQSVTVPFNTVLTFGLNANDPDAGDSLVFATVTAPAKGSVTYSNASKTATYTPNPDATLGDSFTYSATDSGGLSATATVTLNIAGVATVTTVSPASGQYSDPVLLTAAVSPTTAGAQKVSGTVTFTVNGNDAGSAAVDANGIASVSYTIQLGAGGYAVAAQFLAGNPAFANSSGAGTLTVTRENAAVAPSASNPQTVQVSAPGGTASVTFAASITEAADGSPGNTSFVNPVTCTLVPVIPGVPLTLNAILSGGGTGGTLSASCTFANVPVNEYTLQITAGGSYYTGSSQSMFAVVDPSLGFATGSGSFTRNGYSVEFALNAKYLKDGRPQGSITYTEHRPGGNVVVQAAAIQSLSLVGNSAVMIAQATVNGAGAYLLQAIAVDNGEPGVNHDQFAVQITNPDGTPRSDLTFPLTTITGGNIQAHQ